MSFLWNWLWDWLAEYGLASKTGKVVLLGLDNAGKTTLVHMLRDNVLVQHMPTQKPTMETFTLGGLTFNLFDLGGHAIARRQWADYCSTADAIVFLIDASEPERFPEAKTALDSLFTDDTLRQTPLLILANKIDLPRSASEDQLRMVFGLQQTIGKDATPATSNGIRPVEVFMCSILKRQGFKEGFQWLAAFV
jgi:GTP-binding protein SAR1